MARTLRMLVRRDLKVRKGIPYSRQHIDRLIKEQKFPPPDGKTADSPNAPNFWWETTIDRYLLALARKFAEARLAAEAAAAIAPPAATAAEMTPTPPRATTRYRRPDP
jgi:hypothetical protein